jgi:hypothetical protein
LVFENCWSRVYIYVPTLTHQLQVPKRELTLESAHSKQSKEDRLVCKHFKNSKEGESSHIVPLLLKLNEHL